MTASGNPREWQQVDGGLTRLAIYLLPVPTNKHTLLLKMAHTFIYTYRLILNVHFINENAGRIFDHFSGYF